jgi:hypothetical protein
MRSYGTHWEALQLAKRLKDEEARKELRKIRDAQASGRISDQEAARQFDVMAAMLKEKSDIS